jgi:hypothetical protein
MSDNDAVVADENVLDDKLHDSLAFDESERIRRAAQAAKERGESLCKPQELLAIAILVSNRLQLRAQLLFTLPERGRALTRMSVNFEHPLLER